MFLRYKIRDLHEEFFGWLLLHFSQNLHNKVKIYMFLMKINKYDVPKNNFQDEKVCNLMLRTVLLLVLLNISWRNF